jgi:hypothetical protein
MRGLAQSLLRFLELLPWIGQSVRVVNRLHVIRRLEEERRWPEARALRASLLREVAFARSAPLWRSEGEDLLHNRKNYPAALEAFATAERAMHQSPALFGVAAPDRIYAGAAQAALLAGEFTRARLYRDRLETVISDLARRGTAPEQLQAHRTLLVELDARLADAPEQGGHAPPELPRA